MEVTNNSKALQGVNTVTGAVYLQPGETRDLDIPVGELAGLKSNALLGLGGLDRGSDYPPAADGPAPETGAPTPSAYAVVDKGRGWHVITKDGQDATKSLREDAVAGFDAKSEDEKAAFVEANKAD
ncbi:hypothetical protein [Aureimonas psammosilenae]|uniref:hypothetical protein n=1 Tax=Aureimonas psammosilenae TaxID=2495496 RepID=UPI001260FD2D|nr:hypothetical protein [Aureimonas psammosilenae]